MKLRCQNKICPSHELPPSQNSALIRHGTYLRRSDSRKIKRFFCKICHQSFSSSTLRTDYYQKKRRLTPVLRRLLVSGISQRRAALVLRVDRKTVVRRFRYLAEEARRKHQVWLLKAYPDKLQSVQFDDLETSEHTKCKPLSVALAIEPKTRKIIGFQVSQMPAKGRLAKIATKKYGKRKDERSRGWNRLLKSLKPIVTRDVTITSDENPHYPKHIKRYHPKCTHIRIPGGRGAITGQGELKKKVFDPMFALNHTCAMFRANLNRLFRKTWCTTKNKQGLIDHLSLYVEFHNKVLTPPTRSGAS